MTLLQNYFYAKNERLFEIIFEEKRFFVNPSVSKGNELW